MRRLLLIGVLSLATCTPAGPASEAPTPAEPAGPALASGSSTEAARAEARGLVEQARAALEDGRTQEAADVAGRVVEDFPTTPASVDALWIRGLARSRMVPPDGARADLERLLELLPLEDAREGSSRLALARVRAAEGDPAGGLRDALSLPPGTAADSLDRDWARSTARTLPVDTLETVLEGRAGPSQPLAPTVLTSYARALRLAGEDEEAREWATQALDAGAQGFDRATAEALAEGRGLPRPDGDGPVPVGLVLPLGGSPAYQQFAEEIRDGVEAAVEAWGLDEDVELMVLDDAGEIPRAGSLVRAAESSGAVAVLGLLDDATLDAAARARQDEGLTLVSPTAYQTAGVSTFSLNTFDPGAADALAEWAAANGLRQVVLLHGSQGVSADEAQRFSDRFQELGGSVLRSFTYEPGATFFEEQLQAVKDLLPEALVLPVPPEDVPAVAPQVTFFGLDTLGIRILGTGGWTDGQALGETDSRHTDGVVVATPIRPGEDSPGYRRFESAYETRFRRSVVDGLIPALGYDAASLVFQGIWAGAGAAPDVAEAFNRVRDFEGATGVWSVEEGRLRRAHEVVCLEERTLHLVPPGYVPAQRYRPYQPDPETEEIPEGPGRPDGYICPTPENVRAAAADTLWTVDGSPPPPLPDTLRFR